MMEKIAQARQTDKKYDLKIQRNKLSRGGLRNPNESRKNHNLEKAKTAYVFALKQTFKFAINAIG